MSDARVLPITILAPRVVKTALQIVMLAALELFAPVVIRHISSRVQALASSVHQTSISQLLLGAKHATLHVLLAQEVQVRTV